MLPSQCGTVAPAVATSDSNNKYYLGGFKKLRRLQTRTWRLNGGPTVTRGIPRTGWRYLTPHLQKGNEPFLTPPVHNLYKVTPPLPSLSSPFYSLSHSPNLTTRNTMSRMTATRIMPVMRPPMTPPAIAPALLPVTYDNDDKTILSLKVKRKAYHQCPLLMVHLWLHLLLKRKTQP